MITYGGTILLSDRALIWFQDQKNSSLFRDYQQSTEPKSKSFLECFNQSENEVELSLLKRR